MDRNLLPQDWQLYIASLEGIRAEYVNTRHLLWVAIALAIVTFAWALYLHWSMRRTLAANQEANIRFILNLNRNMGAPMEDLEEGIAVYRDVVLVAWQKPHPAEVLKRRDHVRVEISRQVAAGKGIGFSVDAHRIESLSPDELKHLGASLDAVPAPSRAGAAV